MPYYAINSTDSGTNTGWTFSNAPTDYFANYSINGGGNTGWNFLFTVYYLSYSSGTGGHIVGNTTQAVGQYTDGTTVVAVPYQDFTFTGWSDGVLTTSRTDIDVNGNLSVTANFIYIPITAQNAKKDNNGVSTMLGTYDGDGKTPVNIKVNPSNGALKVVDGTTGTASTSTIAIKDNNGVPVLMGVSSADMTTLIPIATDSSGNLLIKST